MKQLKSWISTILSVFLLTGVFISTAQAANPYDYKWEGGLAFFKYNPEGMPDRIAANDPTVTNAEGLSEEEEYEIRTHIVEGMIKAGYRYWSSIPETTLVAVYDGRTDADCRDLSDGIPVICWRSDPEFFKRTREDGTTYNLWAVASFLASRSYFKDTAIFLNADKMTTRWLPLYLKHEQGHNLGLGHYDEEPAIMNTSFHHAINNPGLFPADEAGIYHHYPFTEDCAPFIDNLTFETQVYLDGLLHAGPLGYQVNEGVESLVLQGPLYKDPYGDWSCAIKVDEDDNLNIPFMEYNNELIYLNSSIKRDENGGVSGIEIIEYGPVD